MVSLGTAWVSISPNLATFAAESKAGIDGALRSQQPRVKVSADTKAAIADVAAMKKAIESQPASIQISTGVAAAKLTSIGIQADVLKQRLASMTANINDAGALASIVAIETALEAVKAKSDAIGIGDLGSTAANAEVNSLARQFASLRSAANTAVGAMESVANESDNVGDAVTKVGIVSGNWFSTLVRAGSAQIPLFAGALGMMIPALEDSDNGFVKLAGHMVNAASGWHLMAEAVIETTAIWVPATIAMTAFGLAAAPAVKNLYTQMQNMSTAATGTGQAFASLAMKGQSVTAAVQPTVIEAFGIALHTVENNSGNLGNVLHGLGQDIDQLVAKAAIAFSSKAGGTFMAGAAHDAEMLMQSFESLGSILGSVLKAVPGYAQVLLGFGNDVLSAAAKVTAAIEPVLAVFLKLHGAILYGGLFGTLASKLFSGMISGAAAAAGGIANLAGKFDILGGESGKLATGAADAATWLDEISSGPVIAGVGLLVGAFAALYLGVKNSTTAAQNFNATLQKNISSAPLTKLSSVLTTNVVQAFQQVAIATDQAATAQNHLEGTSAGVQSRLTGVIPAIQAAKSNLGDYIGVQAQQVQQATNANSNLEALAKTFGVSLPEAVQLATGAQITNNQIIGSGAANLATMKTQVEGYYQSMAVLTPGVGALNQALNALNVTGSAQITDVGKLTQAYASWIGIVTGGDTAFVAFEQGQATLAADLKASKAGLSGVGAAALTARSDFDAQITAGTTLYSNLQTMAVASGSTAKAQGELSQAGKDLVAQMLPMAKGSSLATAELFSMAQIAGYQGVDSLTALSKWVGNTKDAEGNLNQQTTALTISTASLTTAAKNLSTTLDNDVTTAQANVLVQTDGVNAATKNLNAAWVKSSGTLNSQTVPSIDAYYESLRKAGLNQQTATGYVDAFLKQLGATPGQVAIVNAALAKLPKSVNIGMHETLTGSGAIKAAITAQSLTLSSVGAATQAANLIGVGKAAGGIVHGGVHGIDSQLAVLAPGELVIPSTHAAAHMVQAKREGIPGMASGGVAGALSNVPQGEATTANGIQSFTSEAMAQFVTGLNTAFQASQATAATATGSAASGNLLSIARFFLANGFNAAAAAGIASVIDGESGGNPESLSPGAFGLIQWTGNTLGLPAGYHGPTGNVAYDMAEQLRGAIGYIAARGGRGSINAAGSPVLAGDVFSRMEAPLVPLSDTRPGVANQLYAELLSAPAVAKAAVATQANVQGKLSQVSPHSGGGVLNEPIYGVGQWSGMGYSFHEGSQPEYVSNQSQSAANNPNNDQLLRIAIQNMTTVLQGIYRQGAALPNVIGRAIGSAGGAGIAHGYYTAQN